MPIDCFLAIRTNIYRRSLRRYVMSDRTCPGPLGYHNAEVGVGDVPAPPEDEELEGNSTVEFCPTTDPRWPVKCDACPYLFQPTDVWQWNQHRLYENPLTHERFHTLKAPVGAMWYADWMEPWVGQDGHCLCVVLPDGTEWCIDGPDKNGKRCWQRTGIPPKVTVTPSIQSSNYHGWLRDGTLTEA